MRNPVFKIIFFCMCWALFVTHNLPANDVKSKERLYLKHADRVIGETVNNESIMRLIGNVHFYQEKTQMFCEEAIQYQNLGRTDFIGNVKIFDEQKTLKARFITYFEDTKIAVARNHVIFFDSSKTILADSLTYHEVNSQVIADGNVFLADSSENSFLSGQHIDYFMETGYALATEEPVFTQQDTLPENVMEITGNKIEMFEDGEKFKVTHNVVVTRGEVTAHCGELLLLKDNNRIILTISPDAFQGEDFLTGETIELEMNKSEIDAIHLIGDALVSSKVDTLAEKKKYAYDFLIGEDIYVKLDQNKIKKVNVKGRATSYYHALEKGEEKGLNKVQGDELMITFNDNKMESVQINSAPSSSNGVFYPPKNQYMLESELAELLNRLKTPAVYDSSTEVNNTIHKMEKIHGF